jgi:hypothetical protein
LPLHSGASLPLKRPGASPFTDEEKLALKDYSVNSENLNKFLREQSQEHISDSPIVQQALMAVQAKPYVKDIAALDSAFAKVEPLSQDITLFRGLSSSAGNKLDDALAGDSNFMDLGFLSTSRSESVAQDFAFERAGGVTSRGSLQRWAEITVPKGSRVIDMNQHSISDNPSELEVLLNRDSHFYVESVTHPADDQVVYHMRMVPR